MHSDMDLAPGTCLGPYEVGSPLGAGGMGQVYRARDTRLNRTVAIKILPTSLAADPEFRERFDREARLIAQLDHPHICTLYDVGQQGDTGFLVMQFLEGETLARRLERGPLPRVEAIEYATQIASALAVAHRAGIVHRDVKPANIMLTKSGAKLLDFGLAKAVPATAPLLVNATAVTTPPQVTTTGTIMGTFHYMAPEQIEGSDADARSDVWGFGCVVYEMVTGGMPFRGKSTASLFASILNSEPPSSGALGAHDPLTHIVSRSLEKAPDARWQSMVDIAHQLRWIVTHQPQALASPARPAWWQPAMYAALLGVAAAAAAIIILMRRPTIEPQPLKLTLLPPAGVTLTPFASSGTPHFALSPDGASIAFVASTLGEPPTLWVRRLDARAAQQLPGTRDAVSPFWFPDGRTLGFFAEGMLRTIRLDGERPATLSRVLDAAGGASNGEVILIGQSTGPILKTSVTGGPLAVVTVASGNSGGHRWPQFVDQNQFIYTESRGAVKLGSLDAATSTELVARRTTGVFAPPRSLLFFGGSGKLMAQPLDRSPLRPTGPAREVLDDVRYAAGSGFPPVSIGGGVLAYWDGTTVTTEFQWFDRAGNQLTTLPVPASADFAISPDGKRLAFSQLLNEKGSSIWVSDERGNPSRLSFTSDAAQWPIWSADGRQLLFVTRAPGAYRLFSRAANYTEPEKLLGTISVGSGVAGPGLGDGRVTDWAPDGRTVLLSVGQAATAWDVLAVSIESGRSMPVRQTPASEVQGRFSPDNRWIAYASNETGRWEVFVEPFPGTGARSQVSRDGGSQPVWRRDGAELFFIAPDGKIMSVEVSPASTFSTTLPKPLFQTRIRPTYPPYPLNFDVSPDGQRFLVEGVRPETGPTISVIVNWPILQ
jgi:serine/threonine protein kinase/Tol biopolymer transport system component